jgi:DNA-binding FadR family transcriptional regulator
VGEIVASLSERVQQGHLQAGDKLPSESEIMAQFEVSRTVVREALSRLQAAGAVETRHGIGTFVLPARDPLNFSLGSVDLAMVGDVIALLELRISLETEAAGLAAQRRTDAQLALMQTALDEFQAALGQNSDAVPSDFTFHMEVARATHNRHFADLMGYLGTMVIPRARINTAQAAPEGRLNYLQKVHGEHESILSAIRNQDPEAARAAMRTHLSNSRERLRKTQTSEAAHHGQQNHGDLQLAIANRIQGVNGEVASQAGVHRMAKAQHAALPQQQVVGQASNDGNAHLRQHGER